MSSYLPPDRIGTHPVEWSGISLPADYDPGIELELTVLIGGGVETVQSCQGGEGHAYPEPTVEFRGGVAEAFRAFAWARTYGLDVDELRQVWSIQDGVPVGPHWAMTFRPRPASPVGGEQQ